MARNSFRWTGIGLFIVVIVAIGLLNFLIWNEHVEQERAGMDDSSLKAKAVSHVPLGANEEPSQAQVKSKSAGPSSSDESTDKKLKSKDAEPVAKNERTQKEPKPADAAKIYQVDSAASRIYVKVGSATRLGHPHGVEGKLKSGKIEWGAGGELVFDMSSFKADTKEARQKVGLDGKNLSENEAKKVTKTMLTADVLSVEKFPVATYKIIMIKPTERQDAGTPGAYEVEGRFLLHGADNQVKFKAKLERTDKQDAVKLSGSFAIKQSDYGITPYSAVGGLVRVADQLEIYGDLLLTPGK